MRYISNLKYKHCFTVIAGYMQLVLLTFYFPSAASAQDYFALTDPELTVVSAHGGYITEDGRAFNVTDEFVESLLNKIVAQYEDDSIDRLPLISRAVKDDLLAKFLFVDWLILTSKINLSPHDEALLNALNTDYIRNSRSNRSLYSKGVTPLEETLLTKLELFPPSYFSTNILVYITECLNSGVPVPSSVFSDDWQHLGSYNGKISNIPGTPQLWSYYSDSPDGVCIAASFEQSRNSDHLDMICLGRASKNACIFELNIFERNNGIVPITNMTGANDLGMTGVCTDCHSGENPFIIHPDKPAFKKLDRSKFTTGDWHTPLVKPNWISSGPSNLLNGIPSVGQCTNCHYANYAGRFPELSVAQPGYCGILETIVGRNDPNLRTMPADGAIYASVSHYADHIDALLNSCRNPRPDPGSIVDTTVDDDPQFISAPSISGPIYACNSRDEENDDSDTIFTPNENANLEIVGQGATEIVDGTLVTVNRVLLNSTVYLLVNGEQVSSINDVRNPDGVMLLADVRIGDVLTAQQEFAGLRSQMSEPIVVRNAVSEFSSGLPRPVIDPDLVYECASLIAARVVPNSTITAEVNGTSTFSYLTSTGIVSFPPGGEPFEINDRFRVQSELCGITSSFSTPVLAVSAPESLDPVQVSPPQPVDGLELLSFENLTPGARTTIEVDGESNKVGFSSPFVRRNNVDAASRINRPFSSTDRWLVKHELCDAIAVNRPRAHDVDCDDLLPPEIETPLAQTNFVVVSESIPGARIRIYDQSLVELGDSSGSFINLNRSLINSDQLFATQQVGSCVSAQAFRIDVR